MKKYLKTISPYMLVIICMFFWIMYLTECRSGGGNTNTHTTDTVTNIIYDSTVIETPVYVPKWYEKKVYIEVPVWQPVDTASILAECLSTYIYIDTAMDDTSAFIRIYDSISRNQIQARQITFINRRPTEIKHITVTPDYNHWDIAVGGFFGGTPQRFDYGLGVIVTTNNRASYGAEYCFSDKSVRLGYYYNLRK